MKTDLKFVAEKTAMPSGVIDQKTQTAMIHAVYACPNGVIRMSDSMPGFSRNFNQSCYCKKPKMGKLILLVYFVVL